MSEKADRNNLRFRPHFKTHQSREIGNWFRDFGVRSITVSSVSMARYFAEDGWDDITIAFPVNVLEIGEINELASTVKLNILVENSSVLHLVLRSLRAKVGVYIEIDTGYYRSGVEINRVNQVDEIISLIRGHKLLHFKGFLTHTGQTYTTHSSDEIRVRHADSMMKMLSMKNYYKDVFPDVEISLGDTPSCTVCDNFEGVDEIRPGNFVFFDLMQERLGVCEREEVAARVLCPVVSRHLSRNEYVMYGGAVHLSKEFIINGQSKRSYGAVGQCTYGQDAVAGELTWVSGLSQEHGIIKSDFEDIRHFTIGGVTEIIPVHSCLAADLAGHYMTTDGEIIQKMGK
jgi:D-serine deaminase-like pyridoxal phosphate-dependent protein